MAKIAVDVDDTLYSFTALAREVCAEQAEETGDKVLERAAYAPWTEWRTPPDLLGLDKWLDIIELCHDDDMILSREPYPSSQDVLYELHDQGHDIRYVSTRATEREGATNEWLNLNEFPPGELYCVGQDKSEALRECRYLIDDRPKNLIQFVYNTGWGEDHTEEEARIGFGLMTEFNRALTDVPRIYLAPPANWRLLRHYLQKTGVLEGDYAVR
jgi:hypothetical protein